MAGITLAEAEAKLAEYMTAETAVLGNQSYSMEGRSLTRADLAGIQQGITIWNNRAKRLSYGGIRVIEITPNNG